MRIKHLTDIDFTVVVTKLESHYVEFEIYTIEATDMNGNPMFHRKGSPCSPDPVDKHEDADVYLHGSVKWDGCSNWYFDEQDRCMLHGCERQHLTNIGEVMAACWDMAAELLPNFEGDRAL